MGLKAILFCAAAIWAGSPARFDHAHALYAEVLKTRTTAGMVDYAGLKADPKDLDRYLSDLAAVAEEDFSTWTREQRLAYLINLYNAATLRLVVENYPLKSIKDIGNIFKGPWDQPIVSLFGRDITLNKLEHGVIRPDYGESRVHFALVCAARGCPFLRHEPYSAERLDAQLEDQTRGFLAEPAKNRLDLPRRTLFLSPIFKWYAKDFSAKSGSVLFFALPYFEAREHAKDLRLAYTDYDWSLNERSRK